MVFVDNELDPATGTIRGRARLDNHDRQFTPGLFARVKLMGSGQYDAVLVNDSAIGTDQTRALRAGRGRGQQGRVPPGASSGPIIDGLRVVQSRASLPARPSSSTACSACAPERRCSRSASPWANGDRRRSHLAGRQPHVRCPAAARPDELSDFFIDRPIFAGGHLGVHHDRRSDRALQAADQRVPGGRAALGGRARLLPGREPEGRSRTRWPRRSSRRSSASRTCSTCPRPPPWTARSR